MTPISKSSDQVNFQVVPVLILSIDFHILVQVPEHTLRLPTFEIKWREKKKKKKKKKKQLILSQLLG